MGSLRIPLATPLESRNGTLTRDARMKNTLLEQIDGEAWLIKRPGVTNATDVAGGAVTGQGMILMNGRLFAMAGDVLYAQGWSWSEARPIIPENNFAMEPGPSGVTAVLDQEEWIVGPCNPPYYPDYTLKDYSSIDAMVSHMNSAHADLGPWSYLDSDAYESGYANYPWYKGALVCPDYYVGGEPFIYVLRHSL